MAIDTNAIRFKQAQADYRLEVPFAFTPAGEPVAPGRHPAGERLTCPGCDSEVRFRKRAGARAHFVHYDPDANRSCGESALHRIAKRLIANAATLSLAGLLAGPGNEGIARVPVRTPGTFAIERSREERALVRTTRRFPDVLLFGTDPADPLLGEQVAVEIAVTNPLSIERRRWYRERGIPCVEISLKAFRGDGTLEALAAALQEPARQTWIFHPGRAAAEAEYQRQRDAFFAVPEYPGMAEEYAEWLEVVARWRDEHLPAAEPNARYHRWEAHCATLRRHKHSLEAALQERGQAAYREYQRRAASESSADDLSLEKIECMPGYFEWAFPEVILLPGIIRLLATYLSSDTLTLAPEDIFALLAPRVDVDGLLNEARQYGDDLLLLAKGKGSDVVAAAMRVNRRERQKEAGLRAVGRSPEHLARACVCPRCSAWSYHRLAFAMSMPSHVRCRCGAQAPFPA